MGIKSYESNVTATVRQDLREALILLAARSGLSLSRYVAQVLERAACGGQREDGQMPIIRHAAIHSGSCQLTIPPEIVTELRIRDKEPIAFTTVPGGALIRPVR